MKTFLYKSDKNGRKKCFPQDIKNSSMVCNIGTLIFMFTIMYLNSSKIFKFYGQFRRKARMNIRSWAHSWLNRALELGTYRLDGKLFTL